MLKIGFPNQWVNLAMETMRTTSYSTLINKEAKGFITPTRGIKQGDLLSPYLFLLCAEGLSFLIRRAMENQHLKRVLSCNSGVKISHLLFANDSLVFCEQQQLNAETCWIYWHCIREHRGKQLTDKKPHYFSAPTPNNR